MRDFAQMLSGREFVVGSRTARGGYPVGIKFDILKVQIGSVPADAAEYSFCLVRFVPIEVIE